MTLALKNANDKEICQLCHHLAQEGREKLIKWFGKAMFHNMPSFHGILKATMTPQQMLDHIAKTHGKPRDHRLCMETVEAAFDVPHNAKAGVKTCFMKLVEAADDAKSLGRAHTNQQKMDEALGNFERECGKDAHKTKDEWEASNKTAWTAFMVHWKDEIHNIETQSGETHKANQSVQEQVDALKTKMQTMQMSMNAMEEEKQSIV